MTWLNKENALNFFTVGFIEDVLIEPGLDNLEQLKQIKKIMHHRRKRKMEIREEVLRDAEMT